MREEMERIGNEKYHLIEDESEAKRVFVEVMEQYTKISFKYDGVIVVW